MNILIILILLAVAFVLLVATRPADFRVERSATIPAPPAVVFEHINDLKLYQGWNPWLRLEPTARHTFAGPPAGPGAAMAWVGKKLGEGRMTIMESRSPDLIRMKLEFLKPFKATNTAEFTCRAENGQTTVTWAMYGQNNFMAKAMGLFMSMDRMIGTPFEQGLANLRTQVETAAGK